MGLFDLFKGSPKADGKPRSKGNAAAKWADRIEKRAQNYDRQEAIQALSDMQTAEAVTALLRRFTFHMDPSITDQEEKDAAFRGIVRAGKAAIEPVRGFAARAESLAWPMKITKALVEEGEYVEELLRWLSKWDTEYAKFIDPKIQILVALEDHRHEKIAHAVEPFLDDVNEPARFHAVATLLAQEAETIVPRLLQVMPDEESVRIKNKIADGLALRDWAVPDELREPTRKVLPYAYSIDAEGRLTKRN